MYSVVLATVLTAGAAAPDFGGKGLGCHGCYGAAYGGCYGVCYGGWACHGCSGCYGGCGGCYGGSCCGGWSCYGCYGGCSGCCGGSWSACYGGCYGGCCGGWSSCYGGCCGGAVYSCYGGCSGCYGGSCCGGWSCGGCFGGCSGVWAGWSASRPAPRMGVYTAPPAPYYSPAPVVGSNPVMSGPSYAPMMNHAPASVEGSYTVGPVNGGVPYNHAPAVINGGYQAPVEGQPYVPSNGGVVPHGNVMPGPSGGNEVSRPATVVIKAASDVKVLFNGQATTRKKQEEKFKTPLLKAGRLYAYDVVAEVTHEGKTYTASKRITVQAGQTTEVSFGDAREVIAASEAQTARITVLLPEGGKLYVDGKEQGTNAAKQTFSTPKLAKGKTYYYTLKVEVTAANNAGAKTQRVNVEAGKELTVDFRPMFDAAE